MLKDLFRPYFVQSWLTDPFWGIFINFGQMLLNEFGLAGLRPTSQLINFE